MKKRIPAFSFAFYIIAALLMFYCVCIGVALGKEVASYIAAGQLVLKGNMLNIVGGFMSSIEVPLIGAVLIFGVGFVYSRLFCIYEYDGKDFTIEDDEAPEMSDESKKAVADETPAEQTADGEPDKAGK